MRRMKRVQCPVGRAITRSTGHSSSPVPGDGFARAQRGQRVEVEVLAGDIDAEPLVHLAQQQRAGQRVESHARAEQRGLGGDAEQFSAPGRQGQDLPQLADDLRRLAAAHGSVIPRLAPPAVPPVTSLATQSGSSGGGPVTGRQNRATGRSGELSPPALPPLARKPDPASASRSGTLFGLTRHGTASVAAPPWPAERASQASSAWMTPRPMARHDIMSSVTVQVPGARSTTQPPTRPSSPNLSDNRTVITWCS